LAKINGVLLATLQTWPGRFLQQVRGVNPFAGDCLPTRVSLFGFGRPTLPFPHLWNYKNPIKIFETFFWDVEKETGSGKHNRYLYLAGLSPVLLTREPAVIKAVLAATGDKPGQFDRDSEREETHGSSIGFAHAHTMKPFLAELTGASVAYIVIALVVLRLVACRVVSASWIPLFDGVASVLLGAM
jgi:hypothetical protein